MEVPLFSSYIYNIGRNSGGTSTICLLYTVLQSKRANFVVFKIFCYFQESVQEGSTLSLWEDTTSTCTTLWEVTCCHVI